MCVFCQRLAFVESNSVLTVRLTSFGAVFFQLEATVYVLVLMKFDSLMGCCYSLLSNYLVLLLRGFFNL